jgi:CHAT domain-containing protein
MNSFGQGNIECKKQLESLQDDLIKFERIKNTEEKYQAANKLLIYFAFPECLTNDKIFALGKKIENAFKGIGMHKSDSAFLIPNLNTLIATIALQKIPIESISKQEKGVITKKLNDSHEYFKNYLLRNDLDENQLDELNFWRIYFGNETMYFNSLSYLKYYDDILREAKYIVDTERLYSKLIQFSAASTIADICLLAAKARNLDKEYLEWTQFKDSLNAKDDIALVPELIEIRKKTDSTIINLWRNLDALEAYVRQPSISPTRDNLILFQHWMTQTERNKTDSELLQLLNIFQDFNSNRNVTYLLEFSYRYSNLLFKSFTDSIKPYIKQNISSKEFGSKKFNEFTNISNYVYEILKNNELPIDEFDLYYQSLQTFIITNNILGQHEKALYLSGVFLNSAEAYVKKFAGKTVESKVRNEFLQAYLDVISLQTDIVHSLGFEHYEHPIKNLSELYEIYWSSKSRVLSLRTQDNLKLELQKSVQSENEILYSEFKASLKKNEIYIDIVKPKSMGGSSSFGAFYNAFITRSDSQVELLILHFKTTDEKYLENLYKFGSNGSIDKSEAYFTLYNILWAKIDSLITKDITTVYISPDGIFNKINPTVLIDNDDRRLIDKYNIVYSFHFRNRKTETIRLDDLKRNFVIIGNPKYSLKAGAPNLSASRGAANTLYEFGHWTDLPGTQTEIDELESILKANNGHYKIYNSEQANEREFLSIENPSALHIATHGFFLKNSDVLDNCGLVLSGANDLSEKPKNEKPSDTDGYILGSDIIKKRFDKCHIAYLSACETSLGFEDGLDVSYGLIAAFNIAGVKNIIATRWGVDDEVAKDFSRIFYTNLFNSKGDIKSAFHKTQIEIKNLTKDEEKWGPFVLYMN